MFALSPSFQKINEAKQTQRECYEKELINLRIKFEEETLQLKEAHAKMLEEMSWKHQAALEAAQSSTNKEKKKLQMVSHWECRHNS